MKNVVLAAVLLMFAPRSFTGAAGPPALSEPRGAHVSLAFTTHWREGQHSDLLETKYQAQTKAGEFPLPQECVNANFTELGRPLMVDEGGRALLFGASGGSGHAHVGKPVPIYFWLVNYSDNPQTLMTCDIDWFVNEGLDVFDAGGNRLPAKKERDPKNRRPEASCPFNYACDKNMIFPVPAHTCIPPDPAKPFDLTQWYALPAGEYVIRPAKTLDCHGEAGKDQPPIVHSGELRIRVEP